MLEEIIIERYVKDFQAACCPFGYSDIYEAVRHAMHIGKDGEWVFDLVEEQSKQLGIPLSTRLDIVYIVLEHILQEAANAIDTLTGVNILDYNYVENPVCIYGNYMMSEYIDVKETIEVLTDVFRRKGVTEEDLDQTTLYFLEQIEFDWTLVSPNTQKD